MSKKLILILSLLTLTSCGDQYIEIHDSSSEVEISNNEESTSVAESSSSNKTTEENVTGLPWL